MTGYFSCWHLKPFIWVLLLLNRMAGKATFIVTWSMHHTLPSIAKSERLASTLLGFCSERLRHQALVSHILWFFPLKSISHLLFWYPITLGFNSLGPQLLKWEAYSVFGVQLLLTQPLNGHLVITHPGDSTMGNYHNLTDGYSVNIIIIWYFYDRIFFNVDTWNLSYEYSCHWIESVCYLQTLAQTNSIHWQEYSYERFQVST